MVPLSHTAPHGQCNRVQHASKAYLQQGETETLSKILTGLTHEAVCTPETTATCHRKTDVKCLNLLCIQIIRKHTSSNTNMCSQLIFIIPHTNICLTLYYTSNNFPFSLSPNTYKCPCLRSSHTLRCSTGLASSYQW